MTAGITPEQQAALRILAPLVAPATYLGGGVAVALRLHHRRSLDVDLFSPGDDVFATPDALAVAPSELRVVDRAPGTVHLEVAGVPASLLRYRYPLLAEPETLENIALPVASLDDLQCMKLSAIAGRGAVRDFWDLHAMLTARGVPLDGALDAYQRKYASEDIGHVVRSLVYFADAEAEPRPDGLSGDHWRVIRSDLEAWVRSL